MSVIERALEGNAQLLWCLQVTNMCTTDIILQWDRTQWRDHMLGCLTEALNVPMEGLICMSDVFPSLTLRGKPTRVKIDFSKPADFKGALTASKAIFRNLAKELGMNLAEDIRDITFHSCRATMVDLSAAAGCSIAQILTQMRSMSPEVAMRYIRENGSMVAQVSEDIKEMLIKKDNALLTDAADDDE
jgi:hypothetical protein